MTSARIRRLVFTFTIVLGAITNVGAKKRKKSGLPAPVRPTHFHD
jgi:hypothetical protein